MNTTLSDRSGEWWIGHTFIIIGENVVRALHVVRARVDVVAAKLGIIILSSSSFSFFPSTYFSPRRGLPRKLKFGGKLI